ncbi:MAG TPA: flagellar assembly protein FliH [Steroidobacteraceae bacterium]|nr:flagellar assembly protein FliH [Steroidobacteraceae bacterium]
MSEAAPRAAAQPAAQPAALWELPALGGPVLPLRRRSAELSAIEREAWEQGHAEGREVGLIAAREEALAAGTELERRLQQLQGILDFMSRPLAELDQQVQRQLAALAGAIARQLVRRELRAQPDEIVAVVRETIALLPVGARQVRVHLHPEDAGLVRSRLASAGGERAWSLIEDPMLARGGCRVTSESSSIDATLEQRLGAVIATLLGDERSAPRAMEEASAEAPAAESHADQSPSDESPTDESPTAGGTPAGSAPAPGGPRA